MTYSPDSLSGFKAPMETLKAALSTDSYAAPRQGGQQSHHSPSESGALPGDNLGRSARAFERMNEPLVAKDRRCLLGRPAMKIMAWVVLLVVAGVFASTVFGKALPQAACDAVHHPAPCYVTQLP